MPKEHVVSVDPFKPLAEESRTGHNRWHEAIEPAVEADPGDTVVYETRDAFDGQLNGGSTGADVEQLDLNPVHPLTGFSVKGAEQGSARGELVNIEADRGSSGVPIRFRLRFLRDEFPDPLCHGTARNAYAESDQYPACASVATRTGTGLARAPITPRATAGKRSGEREDSPCRRRPRSRAAGRVARAGGAAHIPPRERPGT